jgi:hypothetical protein
LTELFPQDFHGFSTNQQNGYFLVEFVALIQNICQMSHTGPILAEKSPKNPFLGNIFGKIPKKWKNPKKIFFFQPNKVGFSRFFFNRKSKDCLELARVPFSLIV